MILAIAIVSLALILFTMSIVKSYKRFIPKRHIEAWKRVVLEDCAGLGRSNFRRYNRTHEHRDLTLKVDYRGVHFYDSKDNFMKLEDAVTALFSQCEGDLLKFKSMILFEGDPQEFAYRVFIERSSYLENNPAYKSYIPWYYVLIEYMFGIEM